MNKGIFGAFSGRRKSGGILRPIWETPATGSIALATNYSWTHNLGRVPQLITYGAKRISDGLEYYNVMLNDTVSGVAALAPWATATTITIPGANNGVYAPGGSAAAPVSLVGSYRFFVRIWA